MNNGLTFRSSKIVYYGPHECANCGATVVKMGAEFGGNAFDQPDGPIYPNTEWHVHICNPKNSKTPSSRPIADRLSEAATQPLVPSRPAFNGPTCRGSYALGTACGHCERCEHEQKNVLAGGSLS